MPLDLIGSLVGLALLDSVSVGTLLIPVFFLLAPRVSGARLSLYLATIAVFYFAVGVALLLGAGGAIAVLGEALDSPVALWVQLGVGAVLLAASFLVPTKQRTGDATSGRLARWRARALEGSPALVMGVAVAAGVVELATMLPYLGAVGLLSTTALEPATRVLLLAAYCVVMIIPALALLLARLVARRLVEAPLARFAEWLQRTGRETTAWIIGIVGFLLARDAASRLSLFALLGELTGRG